MYSIYTNVFICNSHNTTSFLCEFTFACKIPITHTFGEEKDNGSRDRVLSLEINNHVYIDAPFTRNYCQRVNSTQSVN